MNIQLSYKDLKNLEGVLKIEFSIENFVVKELAFDSRVKPLQEKSTFVALIGEQFDAHAFIDDALAIGYTSFVVSDQTAFHQLKQKNIDVIFVRNTLRFTQLVAQWHRSKFNYPVIGITGSNGKTICKEWIYELLKLEYRVLRSPKSYNSQIGVAFSILEMNDQYDLAIIEAGISKPEEMRHLQEMILPTFGLFTNNLEAHLNNFGGLDQKNIEKHVLFKDLDKFVENQAHAIADHDGSWSENAVIIKYNDKCTDVTINGHSFRLNFTESFLVENAINSYLVAKEFSNDHESLLFRMSELRPIAMRWEQFEGINNNLLINDSYSLDYGSLKVSLNQLASISDNREKLMVLSGLNLSKKEYVELEIQLQSSGIKKLIHVETKGEIHFGKALNNVVEVANYLEKNIQNSIILFKAVRSNNIGSIIKRLKKKNHRTSLEIDLTKMKSNLMTYRNSLTKNTKLLVMVKAASYGAGLKEVTSFLSENNVDYLGVAFTDEGLALRKEGVKLPIMIMNPDEEYFAEGIKANLEPVIHSLEHLDKIINVLVGEGKKDYPIHIKFNTGMNRLGMSIGDIPHLIDTIKAQPEIRIKSVLSHFSNADDTNMDSFSQKQFDGFLEMCKVLEEGLQCTFDKHICNSNATLRFPEYHLDMVRLGIGLHGMSVTNAELDMTMQLKSYIAQIQVVNSGEYIGYGNNFKIDKKYTIGIIPIGYADGITRSFGDNGGFVYVNGQFCKVLGQVCMDMLMIDLSSFEDNDFKIGDSVEFFGPHISIEEHAAKQNTISYEVISRISERVSRVYLRD